MKKDLALIGLICILVAVPLAEAKSKLEVRTVTGCLSKGEKASEFTLDADDGSTWQLRSPKVRLGRHVGHIITTTGVVAHAKLHNLKEGAKDAAKATGAKKDTSEHGHLIVTNIKMIAASCKK